MPKQFVEVVDIPESTLAFIEHHGIKGMRWGVRRVRGSDGRVDAVGTVNKTVRSKKRFSKFSTFNAKPYQFAETQVRKTFGNRIAARRLVNSNPVKNESSSARRERIKNSRKAANALDEHNANVNSANVLTRKELDKLFDVIGNVKYVDLTPPNVKISDIPSNKIIKQARLTPDGVFVSVAKNVNRKKR